MILALLGVLCCAWLGKHAAPSIKHRLASRRPGSVSEVAVEVRAASVEVRSKTAGLSGREGGTGRGGNPTTALWPTQTHDLIYGAAATLSRSVGCFFFFKHAPV